VFSLPFLLRCFFPSQSRTGLYDSIPAAANIGGFHKVFYKKARIALTPFTSLSIAYRVGGSKNFQIPDRYLSTSLKSRAVIHIKEATIWNLLPRPFPGRFTPGELAEFERRIRNLSLFEEKFTLSLS
jgi:hypothetical protein